MGLAGILGILAGWLALLLVLARVAGLLPRLTERQLRTVFAIAAVISLALSLPIVRKLYAYTADDAYLIARYAAHLVESGRPVFNPGEPVNAITTPLTMLVMSLLYLLSPENVMPLYKGFGLALYLIGLGIVLRATRSAVAMCIFIVLISLSPYHSLWLAGGLETPLLSFLLLLMAVLATRRPADSPEEAPTFGASMAIAVLASLAFATRFDSVLFTAPLLLHLMWRQRPSRRAAAVAAVSGLLPAAILAFNLSFYGDLLPTSFYLKTRTPLNWQTFVYVIEFFLYSGLFAFFVFLSATERRSANGRQSRKPWRDPVVALWAGVFLFCLPYATFTSTAHMMYGFRAFVPYLVVMAYLIARQVAERTKRRVEPGPSYLGSLLVTVVIVVLVQAGSALITPRASLNASRIGEFRAHWDIPAYLGELANAAGAVRKDRRKTGKEGRFRVYSPNEGIVSWVLLDEASVYGRLTGFRRACPVKDYALASDYAIVEEPFLGLHLRDIDLSKWELVYEGIRYSRGHHARQKSRVLAYRNPRPDGRDFRYGVNDPCPADEPVTSGP